MTQMATVESAVWQVHGLGLLNQRMREIAGIAVSNNAITPHTHLAH